MARRYFVVLTDSDTTDIMLPSLFPFLAQMGESCHGQIYSWSIIKRPQRVFAKTRYMLILPLFSFDQGRERHFYFGCIMSIVHHYAWKIVEFMSATSIYSLFLCCIGFYSLAVVARQKLRCITSSQVWSWHCAKKIARQPEVHLKHERMMLTGNLRQPSITSITGIV